MAPLLDFTSQQDIKQSKGKQKAGKSKKFSQEIEPQTSSKNSRNDSENIVIRYNTELGNFYIKGRKGDTPPEFDGSTSKDPIIKQIIDGSIEKKSLHFAPDEFALKIEEAKKDPSKNTWNLPMANYSRDQIMTYIEGYFGAKRSEILQSIHRCEPTFSQMVSTAVNYCNDKHLTEQLLLMVEDVFESLSYSEELFKWLLDEKVELAMVLMACFLKDENSLRRVLMISYIANVIPFGLNYDKVEEVLLMVSHTLTFFKQTQTWSLGKMLNSLTLLTVLFELMNRYYNDNDIQNVQRFLVEEGVADLLAEALLCRKSSGSHNEMVDLIHTDSISLIFFFVREVEASVWFSIIPRFLKCFERKMCRYPILLLNFFHYVVYNTSYGEMITIFDYDFIDKVLGSALHLREKQSNMFGVFYAVVKRAVRDKIPNQHRERFEDVLEYMVYQLKQYPLLINKFQKNEMLLPIISSVFMILSTERRDRMINNGTFLMMMEMILEVQNFEEKHYTKLDTVEISLTLVARVIKSDGEAMTLKMANVIKGFPKILTMLAKYIELAKYKELVSLSVHLDTLEMAVNERGQ